MSKIHVVIPVYNAKKYLQQAVDSVLDQPYKGIDIVLVDDGSTDGSSSLCDEIAEKEDRVSVIHKENGGVSSARNVGIEYSLAKASNDDYIAFLDADDVWLPDAVSSSLGKLVQLPEFADIYAFTNIGCNQDMTRFSSPYIRNVSKLSGNASLIWELSDHLSAHVYSVRLLREKNIRFIDGLRYTEDKIFQATCIVLSETIITVPKILQIYRANDSSAMSKVLSIQPIDYYCPVINGWLMAEQHVQNCGVKDFCTGSVLAAVHLLDMSMDHHKRWGNYWQIMTALKEHPAYQLLRNLDPKHVNKQRWVQRELILNHPVMYKIKYNFIGSVEFLVRRLLKIPSVRLYWTNKKYPLTQLPVNK